MQGNMQRQIAKQGGTFSFDHVVLPLVEIGGYI